MTSGVLQVDIPQVATTYAASISSSHGGGNNGGSGLLMTASSRRDMDLPCFGTAIAMDCTALAEADKNWHALSREELQEIQRRVREEKKAARRAVKEFEERFRSQTGRKALKEDREPLEKTYRFGSSFKVLSYTWSFV